MRTDPLGQRLGLTGQRTTDGDLREYVPPNAGNTTSAAASSSAETTELISTPHSPMDSRGEFVSDTGQLKTSNRSL